MLHDELMLLKTWQIKLYRKCYIVCATKETQYCMDVLLWRFLKKCRQSWKFSTPNSSSAMDILKFRHCLTSWFHILTVHVISWLTDRLISALWDRFYNLVKILDTKQRLQQAGRTCQFVTNLGNSMSLHVELLKNICLNLQLAPQWKFPVLMKSTV